MHCYVCRGLHLILETIINYCVIYNYLEQQILQNGNGIMYLHNFVNTIHEHDHRFTFLRKMRINVSTYLIPVYFISSFYLIFFKFKFAPNIYFMSLYVYFMSALF